MHPIFFILSEDYQNEKYERAAVQHLANCDKRKRSLIDRACSAVNELERQGRYDAALFVDMRFAFVVGRKMFNDSTWAVGP